MLINALPWFAVQMRRRSTWATSGSSWRCRWACSVDPPCPALPYPAVFGFWLGFALPLYHPSPARPAFHPSFQVGLGMIVKEGPDAGEPRATAGEQQQGDTAGSSGAAEPAAAAAAGSGPEPMQQDGAQPPAAAEPEPERSEEEWELLNK